MLSIQTKTKVKIGNNEYEISYPNVGQTLEIENLKMILSGNSYGDLVKSSHKTAVELLNLIDGVAYFSVLAEGFKSDFKIEDFTKMEIEQQRQISKGFIPFWKFLVNIEKEINNLDSEENTDSNIEK
jgi:hypothetical protein